MAAASNGKPSKEMIVVSFKEIPENICVVTRFISKAAAKRHNYEFMHHMRINQGQIELCPSESHVPNNQMQNLQTMAPIIHAIPNNNLATGQKTLANAAPVIPTRVHTEPPPAYGAPLASNQRLGYQALSGPMNVAPYNTANTTNFAPITNTQMPISTMTLPSYTSPIMPAAPFGTTPLIRNNPMVATKDSECMTDPEPKRVDREQQCSWDQSVASIGIQCCIDNDFSEDEPILEDNISELPTVDTAANEDQQKEEFLQYVKENSVEYKNYLRECLICGEVCKRSKNFYGHMAVHRGPKCLCFVCGQHLENESLLKTHNCVATKRKARALLRCPQKNCKVVAVSRLELYDHINEHIKFKIHNCSACRKSFCTAQEFLRHLLLRAKCYTEAKRHRSRLYGLRSRADRRCRVRVFTLHSHSKRTAMVKTPLAGRRSNRKKLCEFCLVSFRSKFIYNRHVKKCAALLKKRTNLKKRKNLKKQNKTVNGK